MEYTIQKFANIAGISTRTLRYYDEIGLLSPARTSSSGYRIYGQWEVDQLQQILFYRELGVNLEVIRKIITDPTFDRIQALQKHLKRLLDRREQLDLLIANAEQTIALAEGRRTTMSDREKFEGFKERMIDENETAYGKEIRNKYGDDSVHKSNKRLQKMTEKEYEDWTHLGNEVKVTLAKAFQTGNPASDIAQKAAALHKRWLAFTWDKYTSEAHAELAQMYVDDERFKAFYDTEHPGTAEFLRDAIHIYTGFRV
ncbi:MerR family transcriptional regulator [Alicyclobacillus sp. SO9]|uniref:MerR family transcriptional regulator n=1 Tax=Alicyclobacillus sp. SO9 TaxID=2665646 RepID=UPI0018E7A350|nr:MerR family transcriptional regulator [Alicyclobacillus sp. SO9]QQE77229.1 MerR family transcriptional regulator [Alicyclobacillus sp. SO9]